MDFVIIWVDGNDPKWQLEKAKYSEQITSKAQSDGQSRYRDWELLKYWFRGVEQFAPWVEKVHFITCGHYPEWLNLNHPKLNFVKHSDYIPEKYLPTFNSHTIELNLHRIKNLSEEFVYFNDDMFLVGKTEPTDFFQNGLPCEEALMQFLVFKKFSMAKSIDNYNTVLINKNFKKRSCFKKNLFKYFNPKYGLKSNLYSLYTFFHPLFTGFKHTHTAQSFLKHTFEKVWEKENDFLDQTCLCKFRGYENVNQYIFHHWQIAEGNFIPSNFKKTRVRYDLDIVDSKTACSQILKKEQQIICLNDEEKLIEPYEVMKNNFIQMFETLLPTKSNFEI